ncbi:MAG: transposase [Rhodobacteraceae bacterium]|nr:transposase [Paracoccaceae bacterium]
MCDGHGRPVRLLLTEGQQSDHKRAATLLPDLTPASELIGDKGYDSDAYREALITRGITPCIPP